MKPAGGSEKVSFAGPAGELEGLWLPSVSDPVGGLVVLCHPHPLHGGTMETRLVARSARRIAETGLQTLRFNFRGVGRSAGSFDEGRGERLDLAAAIDYGVSRAAEARVGVFGFSFGAMVALRAGREDPRVEVLAGVAPPVRRLAPDFEAASRKPTLIAGAGRDSIVDPGELRAWAGKLRDPSQFRMFDQAEHLFVDEVDQVAELVAGFFLRTLAQS